MPAPKIKSLSRSRAKKLRYDQTEIEARLWVHLRSHRYKNIHFRRQHPIGEFIVDFCAPRAKLIIELDGSQHVDDESYDNKRTAFLSSKGYHVLRFWNNDISNRLDDVLLEIDHALNDKNKD